MMRARFSPQRLTALGAASVALVLAACLGGTGTDTENGLSVSNGSGVPQARVQVRVYSATSTPEAPGIDPVAGGSERLVTDSNGVVRFHLTQPGKYLVEGRRGDTVLFLDTLQPAKPEPQKIVAKKPSRLSGNIRLLSGYSTDTGLVFLRGSGIASPVDRDGNYDLGWGPADAPAVLALGIRYGASPVAHTFVKMAAHKFAGTVLSGALAVNTGSALVVAKDSLTLFKAAKSTNKVCLDDSNAAVTPAYSVVGDINNGSDVVRQAGVACQGKSGALIRAEAVDSRGHTIAVIDSFVLPDTLALGESKLSGGIVSEIPLSQRAISVTCIVSPSKGTTYRTTVHANGEIRVDDIRRDENCLPEIPKR